MRRKSINGNRPRNGTDTGSVDKNIKGFMISIFHKFKKRGETEHIKTQETEKRPRSKY